MMPCLRNILFRPSVVEILQVSCSRQFRRPICSAAISSNCSTESADIVRSTSSPHSRAISINDTITLQHKVNIPRFGLGVYDIDAKLTRQAVLWALECGYRQIDTAARYKNEKSVGEAIRESGINRDEVFVVTKVYHEDHGYHETLKAFEKSRSLLGLDFVDLYLIHFPVPGKVIETWQAMAELKRAGLSRSIGVSNFNIHHLEALKMHSNITPSVNQIEVHPYLQERSLVNYCNDKGIKIQAYSPLTRGKKLEDPLLKSLANEYNKTTAQVLLRWSLQKGFVCIPKSFHLGHIKENAKVFEFEIEKSHMEMLDGLEEGFRTGRDKILWPWNG